MGFWKKFFTAFLSDALIGGGAKLAELHGVPIPETLVSGAKAAVEQWIDAKLGAWQRSAPCSRPEDNSILIKDAQAGITRLAKTGGESARDALERFTKTKDPDLIIKALRSIAEDSARAARNKEAAEAYREVGAFSFFADTNAALEAYTKAETLDPGDPETLNRLGLLYQRIGDLDKAQAFFGKIVTNGRDKETVARVLVNLGNLFYLRGNFSTAETYFGQALKANQARNNKAGIAAAYNGLGLISESRGDFDRAQKFYGEALKLYEAANQLGDTAVVYGNLGNVFLILGNLDRAEEAFKRALRLNESLGRREGAALNYGGLGNLYGVMGDFSRAESAHRKSLEIAESMNAKQIVATAKANLGNVYGSQGNHKAAEAMHAAALDLNLALNNTEGMAYAYGNLGMAVFQQGDFQRARDLFHKALALNEALGSREGQANNHENLGLIAFRQNERVLACSHWRNARDLYSHVGLDHLRQKIEGWMSHAGC